MMFLYVRAGAVGHFSQERWKMASQAKYDSNGEIVALHQLWRSGYGRFNAASTTMKVDLRKHPNYYYSREGKYNDTPSFATFATIGNMCSRTRACSPSLSLAHTHTLSLSLSLSRARSPLPIHPPSLSFRSLSLSVYYAGFHSLW